MLGYTSNLAVPSSSKQFALATHKFGLRDLHPVSRIRITWEEMGPAPAVTDAPKSRLRDLGRAGNFQGPTSKTRVTSTDPKTATSKTAHRQWGLTTPRPAEMTRPIISQRDFEVAPRDLARRPRELWNDHEMAGSHPAARASKRWNEGPPMLVTRLPVAQPRLAGRTTSHAFRVILAG